MKILRILALNTFKEIIRDRILYGLVVFAVILMFVSLAMGQLSFSEQLRISANFGLAGIHMSSIILAIFVGSTLVSKEIDKKTILTLLARPISRTSFIIGKALGLTLAIAVVITGLVIILMIVLWLLGLNFSLYSLFLASFAILLEAVVLLGFSILLSSFTRPILVASISIGVFIIGHWIGSLKFFARRNDDVLFGYFTEVITRVMPDLERFNLRYLIIESEVVPASYMLTQTTYAVVWFSFLISITALALKKKDFG